MSTVQPVCNRHMCTFVHVLDTAQVTLELGEKIGQGTFGTVYKAKYGDRIVAAKVVNAKNTQTLTDVVDVLSEYRANILPWMDGKE